MYIDTLTEQFKQLNSSHSLAALLNTTKSRLFYNLYKSAAAKKYKTFYIPKKSGEPREISAPIGSIKSYQSTLSQILSFYYLMTAKSSSHGFIFGRSIATNAKRHVKKKFVLNLDLEDFFPTINFGRVRGLFMSFPFHFNAKVATLLAQICTFDNHLPQGAPTSPIISNFICSKLDSEMSRFSKENKCVYTRYADDISVSTSLKNFPSDIAFFEDHYGVEKVIIGKDFEKIITSNGFVINSKKTRMAKYFQHQEVTGITVNKKMNVNKKMLRSVRSMLHAWERFDYEAAETEHFTRYAKKHYNPEYTRPSYRKILKGKIDFVGMVRGSQDKIFQKYLKRFSFLTAKCAISLDSKIAEDVVLVSEGKTDWKHLRSAMNALKTKKSVSGLSVYVQEIDEKSNMNDSELLKCCRAWSNAPNEKVIICMFDNDVPRTIKQVTDKTLGFKYWGNNVYSFTLPVPSHRVNDPELCIELYYSDSNIMTADKKKRRLFLNSEFDRKTLCHITLKDVHCTEKNKINRRKLSIIDSGVIYKASQNIALPKSDFADNVFAGAGRFASFDFGEFLKIFDVVNKIKTHALSV